MKHIFKTLAMLLFLISYGCQAQQMVQTTDDAYKLKVNQQQFINKPLKEVLKEIKPEIKTAFGNNEEGHSFFSFFFLSPEESKHKVIGRKHANIYIYVKEPIDWNFDKRSKGKEYNWTKEDVEKYGNLIVTRIRVIESVEN
ncbi:hypothetical protein [uncultured Flavobacterium sp.]|uniref:hypothetical protein n=1 Tax=uncultured Flavobacterium sp. TaxID=165435 RepID=UPI002930BC5C|nr:hypothetical protein [uncultured Flavobacterium sp.]